VGKKGIAVIRYSLERAYVWMMASISVSLNIDPKAGIRPRLAAP